MLTSLLSDQTFVFWLGILLLTIMMVSLALVTEGVHILSDRVRTFFLCSGILSELALITLLFFIVTK